MADVECTQKAPASFEVIAPESPISASDSESVRYLTIGYGNPGPRVRHKSVVGIVPPVPLLRLQGQWLQRAGFEIGERVRLRVGVRRLVIEVE